MKSWLSAAEIAAFALPGLPATERGVQLLARRSGWVSRPREGRGGGVEYSIDVLPAAARLDYVARCIGAIELPASMLRAVVAEPEAPVAPIASDNRNARLRILRLIEQAAEKAKASRKVAIRQFCDAYNAGKVPVEPWVKAKVKQLSERTVKRWRSHERNGRTLRLAVDRAASRIGSGALDRANGGAVKTYALALMAKQPQLTAHHLRALLADKFPDGLAIGERHVPLPPIRTVQYALKRWRVAYRNELKRVRDPDGYKSTVRFALRVARPADGLNQLWQIDASPADVLTIDGRYSIYVCEDIYSRRIVGLVTKTPRATAVCLTLRKAILAWGVPERVKTDNGSDFVARETQRLFAALAIESELAPPFSPEKKGHVERAIGTMQRDLMRTLPGFVGHSVADRKVIEGRKSFSRRLGEAAEDMFEVSLSPAELQQHLDNWCADIYGQRPHSSLKNCSPFAVAASAPGPIRRVDARVLDMLLMPVAGTRRVTKTGVRIDGNHYLGNLEVGADVMVRMDPADLGRVMVYDLAGAAFLGEAICPDLAGIDPAAFIAAKRAEQKRREDEALAPVRKQRIRAADIAPAVHRQALKNAGGLVEFPKRSESHETPAIAAARAAAEGGDLVAVHSAEAVALHARLISEPACPAVIPLRAEETEHQRWHRARAFEEALERGEQLAADDLLWLGGYRAGPEYRGFAMTYGVNVSAKNEQRPATSLEGTWSAGR